MNWHQELVALRMESADKKPPNCEFPDFIDGNVRICRKCNACIRNRITAWGGKCYAEALTCTSFAALTLTYGRETGHRSQYLDYRDIQKLMYRLRKKYKVRYLVSGEYGEKRGRAHWHILLYFYGEAPELPQLNLEQQHWDFWHDHESDEPIGYVFNQTPDYYGMLYVLSYAVKTDGSDKTTRNLGMSKKPPLGAYYWSQLAKDRLSQGLPFRFEYTLPDAKFSNGNNVRFYLTGASLKLAWQAHKEEWYSLRGNRHELPPIFTEDRPRLLKALVPSEMRTSLAVGEEPYSGLYHSATYYPDTVMYRLHSGDLVVRDKALAKNEETKLWLVDDLQEVIAAGRGLMWQRRREKELFLREHAGRLRSDALAAWRIHQSKHLGGKKAPF